MNMECAKDHFWPIPRMFVSENEKNEELHQESKERAPLTYMSTRAGVILVEHTSSPYANMVIAMHASVQALNQILDS